MSDPRFTDPNYVDPRLSDPVDRNDPALRSNSQWGWIAGLAVIALIVIFLIAGGHNANQTANNGASTPATTTGQMTPHTTTGMGTTSPRPATPNPTMPAPAPAPAAK